MLNEQDIRRVMAETMAARQSVIKAYAGIPLRVSVLVRIRQAAEKLSLPLPPQPKASAKKAPKEKRP